MLPRRNRLTSEQFDTVFSSGKRFHSEFFTLIVLPDSTYQGKVAVVIPKKLVRNIVQRNYIKRKVYHAIGKDTYSRAHIVLVKKDALPASLETLRSAYKEIIAKITTS